MAAIGRISRSSVTRRALASSFPSVLSTRVPAALDYTVLRTTHLRSDTVSRRLVGAASFSVANDAPKRAVKRAAFVPSSMASKGCGEVGLRDVGGDRIALCGFVSSFRNLGGVVFILLRDRSGAVQVTWNAAEVSVKMPESISLESSITVEGVVRRRPEGMTNNDMQTGDVEVVVDEVVVNGPCAAVPFTASTAESATEEARLRYRFLDLRSDIMQRNLRLRSDLVFSMRKSLIDQGFAEIETPTLFRSTPEGAREFVVPTRRPGQFYALCQSPQQYKQMLMVGGIERYFQVARCYRDEGGRADRQPEFTQLDLEMSFVSAPDVQRVIETLLRDVSQAVADFTQRFPHLPKPLDLSLGSGLTDDIVLERVTYHDAMSTYGSDKPDRRLGMPIVDITEELRGLDFFEGMDDGQTVRMIRVPQLGGRLSRKQLDQFVADVNARSVHLTSPGAGAEAPRVNFSVLQVKAQADGAILLKGPLAKHIGENRGRILASTGSADGDLLLVASGRGYDPCTVLGRARLDAAPQMIAAGIEIPALARNELDMFWVVDFPLFEVDDESGVLASAHHPFTAPVVSDMELLDAGVDDFDSLVKVRGQHYDLVANGMELGGGSVRIHRPELQRKVLKDCLKLSDDLMSGFAPLLNSLEHGAPPHAGIALGIDRFVSLVCEAPSVRDVIAFPKSATGAELMTGSPAPLTEAALAEYHISVESDAPAQ